jgi:hypothetical protein
MLRIVEFELAEPALFYRDFQLPRHLGGATARIFEPGESDDITSTLWQHRTHQWLLTVRQDGVGVLTILPLTNDSSITFMGLHERAQRLTSVTHVLNRPQMHLLMGSELGVETPLVFKAVGALNEDHSLMQWVRSSGPRRIAW